MPPARVLHCSALTGQALPPKIPRFIKELPDVTLEQLYALIGPDMKAVDAVIRDRLHSDVVLVRQVAEYIIGSGGKRMRPALVLLAAGALGYEGTRHQELAAVVEFIHTATLLHDDVVDESALRRGHDTANAMFGNAASVLVGASAAEGKALLDALMSGQVTSIFEKLLMLSVPRTSSTSSGILTTLNSS